MIALPPLSAWVPFVRSRDLVAENALLCRKLAEADAELNRAAITRSEASRRGAATKRARVLEMKARLDREMGR